MGHGFAVGVPHGRAGNRMLAGLAASALLVPGSALMFAPRALAAVSCDGFSASVAGSYACTVPAGVQTLAFTAVGANGGSGGTSYGGNGGGKGAAITGLLTVSPGDVLSIMVGGNGQDSPYGGAGGGGWSSIATAAGPLVIAGGGGGGGGGAADVSAGGNGGISGTSGGGAGSSAQGAPGGSGGTAGTGGVGGNPGNAAGGAGGNVGANGGAGDTDWGTGGGGAGWGTDTTGGTSNGSYVGGYAGGGESGYQGGGGGGGYGGGGGGGTGGSGTYGTGGGGGSSLIPAGSSAGLSIGAARVSLSAVTSNTVPGPAILATPTQGDRSLALNWTVPLNDGGSTITGYNVYEGTSAGGESSTPANGGTLITATDSTITGLTPGTIYWFIVKAVNANGEGAASNEVSATAATVPGAPTINSTTVDYVDGGGVTFCWSAAAANGSSLTQYNIYKGTSPGGETFAGSYTPGTTCGGLNGLTNGTQYYFYVTGVNGIGEGAASNEVTAMPWKGTPTVPDAPTMDAPGAGNGQVALSWSMPSSNGGSAILGYNVYQGTSQGGESSTPLNAAPITGTSTTVSGLANGTTYYFTVTAVNANGESLPSNEVAARPRAPSPPLAPQLALAVSADPATLVGPGSVTFTYTLTNPGAVPLVGVSVGDSLCTPAYVAGDANGDGILEPGESWTYRCTATLGATGADAAQAKGSGNGMGVSAAASVVVTVTPRVLTPVSLVDGIAAGVNRGTSGFGTRSLVVPEGSYITVLGRTSPNLAGSIVQVWVRSKTGEWHRITSRLVAADGTVHYFARVSAWTGYWLRFAGNDTDAPAASHGRIATVR